MTLANYERSPRWTGWIFWQQVKWALWPQKRKTRFIDFFLSLRTKQKTDFEHYMCLHVFLWCLKQSVPGPRKIIHHIMNLPFSWFTPTISQHHSECGVSIRALCIRLTFPFTGSWNFQQGCNVSSVGYREPRVSNLVKPAACAGGVGFLHPPSHGHLECCGNRRSLEGHSRLRGKTGRCTTWAQGNQALWSVRLCPPSWWSKTSVTAADDHGCWPDLNHNVSCYVSCRD